MKKIIRRFDNWTTTFIVSWITLLFTLAISIFMLGHEYKVMLEIKHSATAITKATRIMHDLEKGVVNGTADHKKIEVLSMAINKHIDTLKFLMLQSQEISDYLENHDTPKLFLLQEQLKDIGNVEYPLHHQISKIFILKINNYIEDMEIHLLKLKNLKIYSFVFLTVLLFFINIIPLYFIIKLFKNRYRRYNNGVTLKKYHPY